MNGVVLTPLRRIPNPDGDVLHAIKDIDPEFSGFGEAYFTTVKFGAVKGWKRHRRMVMNLIVPCGAVRFVVGTSKDNFQSFDLSAQELELYARLTVSPGLWMAFTGLSNGLNLILNVANIRHDPEEADNCPLDVFPWPWLGELHK